MKLQTKTYRHFGECLWLGNGTWEMGIPLSFGPRLLYFSKRGEENVFYEQPEDAGYLSTPEGWRVYGGTRLWLAPESGHALYAPERNPVLHEWRGEALTVTQAEDPLLHAVKQMEIAETDDPCSVDVKYRITNVGSEPLRGAAWAVSAMREGGVLTAPFSTQTDEITAKPGRILSLWNTTGLDDPRLAFADGAVSVGQRPLDAYFKLGLFSAAGKARYVLPEQTFTKTFTVAEGAAYPDGGVNLEIYACRWMLEFETLAPLGTILPGGSAEHTERWTIG